MVSIRLDTEKKLANYLGVRHVTLTSMGRIAFLLALKALNVGQGSEVILPSYTCSTLIEVVLRCGAKPVFADVDPRTFNIKPENLQKVLTNKTKLIVVIHCYGQPSDMDEIIETANNRNIFVVEDVAHALGAEYKKRKVGCFGDLSFFSFSKNMGASSGGAVATNSSEIANKINDVILTARHASKADRVPLKYEILRFARKHKSLTLSILSSLKLFKYATKIMAQTDREIPEFVSVNPSVAIEVKNKLDKIDEINSKRMNGAKILREMLGRSLLDKCILELPYEASDRKHVYYRFPVKVYNKKKFFRIANFLKKYVYVLPPWKCPYGIEAKKLSEQLLLFDMKPSLLETHDLVNLVF